MKTLQAIAFATLATFASCAVLQPRQEAAASIPRPMPKPKSPPQPKASSPALTTPQSAPDFQLPTYDAIPLAKDTIKGCRTQYPANEIDSCDTISALTGLTTAQFITYNPSVGLDCSKLTIGQAYCISVDPASAPSTVVKPLPPKPKGAPGATLGGVANCSQWQKIFPGDVADKPEVCKYLGMIWGDIGEEGLRRLNPGLEPGCANIQVNTYLCVRVPTTTH